MSDDVQVKLGAQTDQLKAAMRDGASSVSTALKEMGDALAGFNAATKRSSTAATTFGDDVKHAFGVAAGNVAIATVGMGRAMMALVPIAAGAAAGIAAAIMGVGAFAILRLEDEVRKLENVLGMMSDEATHTAIALRIIGKDANDFNAIALKVAQGIRSNEQEMNRLGVTTRDASTGALLPLNTIMRNAFETMQTYKAGTDQAAFAQTIFTRGAHDVYEIMDNLPAAQKRATELMRELGIEMGPKRQAEIEAYRIEMGTLRVIIDSVAERVGEAMLPGLRNLANWLNSEGPAAAVFFVDAIKGILAAFATLKAIVVITWEILAAFFSNLATEAVATGRVVVAVFTGEWGKIPGIVSKAYAEVEARSRQARNNIIDAWQGLGDQLGKLFDPLASPKEAPGRGGLGSGSRGFTPKPHHVSDDTLSALENELKAEEFAYNKRKLDEGSFEVWSIKQTRDYWEEVLSITDLGVKARRGAEERYYAAERTVQEHAFAQKLAAMETERASYKHNLDAQIAIVEREYAMIAQRYGAESAQAEAVAKRLVSIRQALADQRLRIGEIEMRMEEARAQFAVDQEQLALNQALSLRQINASQAFAIETDLENRLYASKVAAIEKARALAGDDLVKQKELDAQLEALAGQHQSKLTQIANAAELERKQFAIAASQAVEDSFGGTLAKLASDAKNWKTILNDAFKSLADNLNRIAGQQIAKQIFGAGTEGGGAVSGLMNKIFGGGITGSAGAAAGPAAADASLAALATTATTTTASFSAVDGVTTTMAAAFAAVTGAANAAAAALATVGATGGGGGGLGGMSSLFGGGGDSSGAGYGAFDAVAGYAAGTNYVPRDQLAFVHRGEAVIPAAYNADAKSTRRGGGLTVHNSFVIQGAIDGRTQDQIAAKTALATQRASYKIL